MGLFSLSSTYGAIELGPSPPPAPPRHNINTTPPHPRAISSEDAHPDTDTDADTLDELTLTYLDTLDTYQAQRAALSAALSRGFLSLAQANFATPGRRFGQDFYDGRMSALRGVEATESADGSVTFRVRKLPPPDADADSPDPRDPLRWFGILVPPALRNTQSEFAASVDAAIPQLLTTLSALSQLEARVARARTRHVYKVLMQAPATPLLLDDGGCVSVCTAAQVPGVAAGPVVWLLKIPVEGVRGRLRWEGGGRAGGRFQGFGGRGLAWRRSRG